MHLLLPIFGDLQQVQQLLLVADHTLLVEKAENRRCVRDIKLSFEDKNSSEMQLSKMMDVGKGLKENDRSVLNINIRVMEHL